MTSLPLRFALRELRGGLKGFYIFLACIAIGVAAIGGVNSVSRALSEGIERQGRAILGGDVAFSLIHRQADDEQMAFFKEAGTLGTVATLRAVLRRSDGADQALVEMKAVDPGYPHVGKLVTDPPLDTAALLGERDGLFGAVLAPELLQRLNIDVGDRVALGNISLQARGIIHGEPDALSGGLGLAPRLIVSQDALQATGLVRPGSLITWRYRVSLPRTDAESVADFADEAKSRFPDAGWRITTSARASPRLQTGINRFTQFLTLVGLTALLVGGVGVANAVSGFIEDRRQAIATLKCLGAPVSTVLAIYLAQVLMIALLGIAIGLIVAATMPLLARWALAGTLPVEAAAGFYPTELLLALLFGLLITLAFSLWPLGRARDVPPTDLFREAAATVRRAPGWSYRLLTLGLVTLTAALAVGLSDDRRVAMIYVVATALVFLILRGVASALMVLAGRVKGIRNTEFRHAVRNIHGPGALTSSVVLSLGLGLTLLVALALIDFNLRRQLVEGLPEDAPSFFFVDIQRHEIEPFADLVARTAPGSRLVRVPMLRGRITALKGIPVGEYDVPGREEHWVLRGDRGITYAQTMPDNAVLEEGEWWPPDYQGEPLVSFSSEEAEELRLGVGDRITINVLGREITARIANLRGVDWESLGINFVMLFSPNTFAGAPHTLLATLTLPGENADPAAEQAVLTAVTEAFPTVTSVRVKEALEAVAGLVADLAVAVRAAASVTLIASVLVLGGALAAGHRRRRRDAIVLKTLGATRLKLLAAFGYEYGLLGLATALFALAAGGVAAWYVVARVMEGDFSFSMEIAAAAAFLALLVTLGLGFASTWRILSAKAAPELRNL